MTPPTSDPFDRSYQKSSVNDLIAFTNHTADKGETHVAFQVPVAEYVTLPPQLRQMAGVLGVARDAAFGRDEDRLAELKALKEALVQAHDHNIQHLVMLSNHRKDPSIQLNAGYEFKQPKASKGKINLLDMIPELSVKHLEGVIGALIIIMKRPNPHATFELQMTETPEDEASWKRVSEGIFSSSRFESRGYEPTKRISFRARYHEGGSVGRWCRPVTIIVI